MINNQITTRLERATDALNNQMIRVFVNPQQKILLFAVLIIYNCLMVKAFAMDGGFSYPPGEDPNRRGCELDMLEPLDDLPQEYQNWIAAQSEAWLRAHPTAPQWERRTALAHIVNEANFAYQRGHMPVTPTVNNPPHGSWNTLGRPLLYAACTIAGLSLAGFGLSGLLDFYAELVSPPKHGAVHYIQHIVTTVTNTSSSIERWLYSNGHFAKTTLSIGSKAFRKVLIRALFVSLASLLCGADVSGAADNGGVMPHHVFQKLVDAYKQAKADFRFCDASSPEAIEKAASRLKDTRQAISEFQEANPAFYDVYGEAEFRNPVAEAKIKAGAQGISDEGYDKKKGDDLKHMLNTDDTKITPSDSMSVAPAAPDSPKAPAPINQTPAGINNPPSVTPAVQPPASVAPPVGGAGDLSAIVQLADAQDRAAARVDVGLSGGEGTMGGGQARPGGVGYLAGDHPEINTWSQFFVGGGKEPALLDYVSGAENLSDDSKELRSKIIWRTAGVLVACASLYAVVEYGPDYLDKAYKWYYDIQPKPLRRAGFLKHSELGDWLFDTMEDRYTTSHKVYEALFGRYHDVSLTNGWAGKSHMYELFPEANKIVRMLPQAYCETLVKAFPAVGHASDVTGVGPIKLTAIAATAAAQTAKVALKTAAGQWAGNVVAGIGDGAFNGLYSMAANIGGAGAAMVLGGLNFIWGSTKGIFGKTVDVAATNINSLVEGSITLLEKGGVITNDQAKKLRETRKTFNNEVQKTVDDSIEKARKGLGLAGVGSAAAAVGSGSSSGDKSTTGAANVPNQEPVGDAVIEKEPFPGDGLLICTLFGMIIYLMYQNSKPKSRRGGDEKP